MIIDNCPAHPKMSSLEAITLIFLPPNVTSRLQPCDMGIIKNLKVKYHELVAQRLLSSIDTMTTFQEINILDTMQMVRSAWRDVTSQTVANCFHKAGFANRLYKGGNDAADPPVPETLDDDDDDDIPLARLFPAGDVTFDDYAAADDAVETCEEPSASDIVEEIVATCSANNAASVDNSDNEEDDDEHGTAAAATVPSTSDAMTAIDTATFSVCSAS